MVRIHSPRPVTYITSILENVPVSVVCAVLIGGALQTRKWAQEEESRNLSGADFSLSDARRELEKATVLDKIRPKLDSAEIALAYARSAAPWFEGMPKAIVTASSDGDGKFSMKLPRSDKFAIVAHASRQVFSSREEYYWTIQYLCLSNRCSGCLGYFVRCSFGPRARRDRCSLHQC